MTSFELFAGAGGLALGVEAAGFSTRGFSEMNETACSALRAAWPSRQVLQAKLERTGGAVASDVDLLAGGPPCQPFSSAGGMKGEFDPRDGFPAFIRQVATVKPRAFLIENVRGLLTKRNANYVARVLAELRALGYHVVAPFVLNAADFGVPQIRHRCFIIGFRDPAAFRRFAIPTPTHSLKALVVAKWVTGTYWVEHGLDTATFKVTQRRDESAALKRVLKEGAGPRLRWRTIRDAIGGSLLDVGDRGIYFHAGSSSYAATLPDMPVDTIQANAEAANTNHAHRVASGLEALDKTKIVGGIPIARSVRVSPLVKKDNQGRIHVSVEGIPLRRLTAVECAALQGFPKDHPFRGSVSSTYRQIGNAVPPPLAHAVAKSIHAALESP